MKRTANMLSFLLLFAASLGACGTDEANAQATKATSATLSVGDRAPSRKVRMRGVDGRHTTIDAVAGKRGTLVVFTCNHCPWAQAWEGRITALGNEFLARGIGVIAINSNDPTKFNKEMFAKMQPRAAAAGVSVQLSPDTLPEMKRRATAAGMRFPYVVDETSEVARSFGASKTPEAYLFDARGRLVYHGAVDDRPFDAGAVESHFLRDALRAVVAGRKPARAESRAIGCAIAFRDAG